MTDSDLLLSWYDQHARTLPWRVSSKDLAAGVRPDPYRVWLSEVMLQQTTVASVKSYFEAFTTRWPTVFDLAKALDEEILAQWAGLGYYARARNLIKCAREVAARGGVFPNTYDELLKLPGIGPYTAAAIASIAFFEPAVVVDGNVERVMTRKHALNEALPQARPRVYELAARDTPAKRPGEYAQAVMDLGATICTPKNPSCEICPWMLVCQAYKQGNPLDYPVKAAKKKKPTRLGHVFVVRGSEGEWGLERRGDRGLLGGMEGFPGSQWSLDPQYEPPMAGAWEEIGTIKHTFTHFHLHLTVWQARLDVAGWPNALRRVRNQDFDPSSLPTVFKKVALVAQEQESGLFGL